MGELSDEFYEANGLLPPDERPDNYDVGEESTVDVDVAGDPSTLEEDRTVVAHKNESGGTDYRFGDEQRDWDFEPSVEDTVVATADASEDSFEATGENPENYTSENREGGQESDDVPTVETSNGGGTSGGTSGGSSGGSNSGQQDTTIDLGEFAPDSSPRSDGSGSGMLGGMDSQMLLVGGLALGGIALAYGIGGS